MGAGNVGLLFWGVRLADNQADVLYGLLERGQGAIMLPGDTVAPAGRETVGKPWEPRNGRHWIGVRLVDLPPIPPILRNAIHDVVADRERLADLVELPRTSEGLRRQAALAWDHFAAWCARRDITLPPASLLLVADYD